MNFLNNLDFISVGLAAAAIGILGFVVFFSDRKSITTKTFLLFSLITIFWGAANYFFYQINYAVAFWLLRAIVFLGVWHAFSFFQLAYVFPDKETIFRPAYKYILVPVVVATSILTLTPFVFSKVLSVSPETGRILSIENGPGIVVFGIVVTSLIVAGIVFLFRKMLKVKKKEKAQFRLMFTGLFLTFSLILIFNFFLPAFFDNPSFIPLSSVFLLPFAIFTAYAIFKHNLLDIKIITTEIVAFLLSMAVLFEALISKNSSEIVFRFGIFILVLIFGILLIRSVRKEVEQREELQELNKDLKEADVKLEELNRFKTQLLSFASHQLKSPLAAIKGYAELTLEGLYGKISEKSKEPLHKIIKSADSLVALINNLIDFRKIDEGKLEYQMSKTDFSKLVRGVVDELKPLAEEKKLDLKISAADAPVWVNADAQKLRQVVQNLVDNAIKYTQKGFVIVKLSSDGRETLLEVSDSGFGIPKILLPHLFEEFIRDERAKRKVLGSGLGLFIASKIIEAHNGKIWAESEGEEKGSTFRVKLPLISPF